ncbi:MAG: FeoA domain-containing protein, partial [Clostridia bacterium]
RRIILLKILTTTMDRVPVGKVCDIVHSALVDDVKTRFAEMGLVPHTKVLIRKKAPLGDPIEIRSRNYSLCIRKTEAEHITVTYEADYE